MNNIQRAFDRAANSYDEHCFAQKTAGKKLVELIKNPQHHALKLLDLGCGSGISTAVFAEKFAHESLHALDISPALLAKAKVNLERFCPILHPLDYDFWNPAKTSFYDIIYSNMALHWSADFPALLNKIYSLLAQNGTLAFSIPLNGTFAECQSQCEINKFFDKENIEQILIDQGYQLLTVETEQLTLRFPDTLHALQSIKQVGANHVRQRKQKGLMGKKHFDQMKINELTYVIGYFIARKSNA